jgi:hypothetical protein
MGNSCKSSPVSSLEIEKQRVRIGIRKNLENMNYKHVETQKQRLTKEQFDMKQRELNLRVENLLKGDYQRMDNDVRFNGVSQFDRAYGNTNILDNLPNNDINFRGYSRFRKRQQLPTNIIDAVEVLAKERRGYDGGSTEQWLKNMREEQVEQEQQAKKKQTKQETENNKSTITEERIENENI